MTPLNPEEKFTRAEFMVELLNMWEDCLKILEKRPNGTDAEYGTKLELEAAIYVLKRSLPVSELVSDKFYDYLKTVANTVSAINEQYNRTVEAIDKDFSIKPEDRLKKIQYMAEWREKRLTRLDNASQ